MAAQPKEHASVLLDREKIEGAHEHHEDVRPIPWSGHVGVVPAIDNVVPLPVKASGPAVAAAVAAAAVGAAVAAVAAASARPARADAA